MKKLLVSLIAVQFVASAATSAFAYSNPARDEALNMMRRHDFDDALNKLNEAIGFNATDPKNYMLRGKCFFVMHNYALAIEDFNHVVQYSPNYYQAFLWRGTANARLGNDDLAVTDYQQAIRLHPSLARAYFAGNAQAGLPGHKLGAAGPAINDYKQAMAMVYPKGLDPNAPPRTGSSDPNFDNGGAPTTDEFADMTDVSGERAPQMVAEMGRRWRMVQTGAGNTSAAQVASGAPVRGERFASGDGGGGGVYRGQQGDPARTDLATTNAGNTDVGRDDDTLPARKNRRVTDHFDVDPNYGKFGPIAGSQPMDGDANKTISEVTEALCMDSTNPDYYYMRAKAYQKLQDANKAYADYSEAIRLFPQSKYYIGRASLFYQLNKPLLEEADVKSAIACDPTTPRTIHFGGDKYPATVHWDGDGPGGN